MGDKNHSFSEFPDDLPDFPLQLESQMAVQCRERLVQQQDSGIGDQDSRQSNSLLLPPGKLVGEAVFQLRQTEAFQNRSNSGFPLLLVCFPVGTGSDILQYSHVGEQGVVLKHEACPPLLGCQVDLLFRIKQHNIVHQNFSFVGRLDAGDAF